MTSTDQKWVEVATPEDVAAAVAGEGSVWVCHREAMGQHEEAVSAIDDFFAADTARAGRLRRVRMHFGGRSLEAAAGALMADANADVAVLGVGRGELLDRLVGSAVTAEAVRTFVAGLDGYVTGKKAAGPGAPKPSEEDNKGAAAAAATNAAASAPPESATSAPIDLAKMVKMGQDLLGKRQPVYAHKFFLKALGVLDAFPPEDHDDNMRGSIAECLGWLIVTEVVLGKSGDAATRSQRLKADYGYWATQPFSDAGRGLALGTMISAAPFVWVEAEASEAKLAARLKAAPADLEARALLAITMFLKGDVERCLTEALKVHVLASAPAAAADNHNNNNAGLAAFASAVFEGCRVFLGDGHELIRRLGVNFGGAGQGKNKSQAE